MISAARPVQCDGAAELGNDHNHTVLPHRLQCRGQSVEYVIKALKALCELTGRRAFLRMLGEAAMTAEDAVRYSAAYSQAIAAAGGDRGAAMSDEEAPSISVKLSALFPRYEYAQRERVLAELGPRLLQLVVEARSARVALTIDAEESERLELSLELIDRVLQASVSAGWGGFGLAVQAYQKRAPDVLRWLIGRARATRRRLTVRLVKGAYWDSEIKRAQERGLSGYPVFTRKVNTDVSYLACPWPRADRAAEAPALRRTIHARRKLRSRSA